MKALYPFQNEIWISNREGSLFLMELLQNVSGKDFETEKPEHGPTPPLSEPRLGGIS